MSDTPRTEPPFTNCPRTEKVFPFKRMDDGHWYRYQSDAIDLCEELERDNASLQTLLLEAADALESEIESERETVWYKIRSTIGAVKKEQP